MAGYIMALDAGTTSVRCIIFDKSGNVCAMEQKEFPQYFPKSGWVEHDGIEIWQTQLSAAKLAMHSLNISHQDIAAIGITNQRETTLVWDRKTGVPISPAIVWQCRRTSVYTEELKEKNKEISELFRSKTGLVLDPYFSGTKIKWILDNVDGARDRAKRGELCFGTVDTWLIYNLTGKEVHVTDYSNASRTLIFNIHTLMWDKELLDIFDIPIEMLPDVKPSSYIYGYTKSNIFGGEIAISGVAGDQQAALFGQRCFCIGDVKNTYGTGCFMLMNTGNKPIDSKHGLITTIAWGIGEDVTYALEGSVYVAGASIQWLRDELHLIDTAADTGEGIPSPVFYIFNPVDGSAPAGLFPE